MRAKAEDRFHRDGHLIPRSAHDVREHSPAERTPEGQVVVEFDVDSCSTSACCFGSHLPSSRFSRKKFIRSCFRVWKSAIGSWIF
jgi:hypothetical protein